MDYSLNSGQILGGLCKGCMIRLKKTYTTIRSRRHLSGGHYLGYNEPLNPWTPHRKVSFCRPVSGKCSLALYKFAFLSNLLKRLQLKARRSATRQEDPCPGKCRSHPQMELNIPEALLPVAVTIGLLFLGPYTHKQINEYIHIYRTYHARTYYIVTGLLGTRSAA